MAWANWRIYYGDDRCLPAGYQDRNSQMVSKALLDKVAIPAGQIFTIPAEFGPEIGADRNKVAVAKAGTFDMVLLGMGEDGRTANLFPGLNTRKTNCPMQFITRRVSTHP